MASNELRLADPWIRIRGVYIQALLMYHCGCWCTTTTVVADDTKFVPESPFRRDAAALKRTMLDQTMVMEFKHTCRRHRKLATGHSNVCRPQPLRNKHLVQQPFFQPQSGNHPFGPIFRHPSCGYMKAKLSQNGYLI
jgi:hypothetical protein